VSDAVPSGAPAPAHTSRSIALALAPGTLLAGVAGGIAFPILPIAGVRMGLSVAFIGVILAANRAMRVIASPTIGIAADRFGGRRTLLLGLALQIVVMALYTLGIVTHRPGAFFLAGRLVHGPASAGVFVSAQALALQVGGTSHGGSAAGTVRAAIVLGIPVGLVVGGLLSSAYGDAAAFEIAAAGMVVALFAAWAMVPDLRISSKDRPPLGETLRAMRDSRLLAVGALNLVLSFSAGGMVLTTLALLVRERHLALLGSNEQGTSGLLMGCMVIVDVATTPLAGRLGDRWRAHARVAMASVVVLVPGLALIGLSPGVAGVITGIVLVGVGAAGLGPSLLVMMGALVPRERRGTGAGLLQLCGDVGGMLGPLVGTALFASSTALPYLGTAGLVACSVLPAAWLARIEVRRNRAQVTTSDRVD
jgi:ACDE family multidrug resistance protein